MEVNSDEKFQNVHFCHVCNPGSWVVVGTGLGR